MIAKKLCKILNIKFSKSMTTPTILGKKHLEIPHLKKKLRLKERFILHL